MSNPPNDTKAQPGRPAQAPAERRAIIEAIMAEGAAKALPGPPAERSQDFLYGEDGMPG